MKNQIIIKDIKKHLNQIEYNYTLEGEWKQYFNLEQKLCMEYSQNIEEVPDSIAVIPLVCNILPIAWIVDANIRIQELDRQFYDSINEFKKGYIKMYPHIKFEGNIIVNEIIENQYETTGKSGIFFSGGVDAYFTLLSHIEEKPILMTIWGADVTLNDEVSWNTVKTDIAQTAKQFQLEERYIKSSFRTFLYEEKLNELVYNRVSDLWWHGFQHGIGIISHAAPIIYIERLNQIYIASSFSIKDQGNITCASDPSIDNFVKVANCKIIHDGYEYTRQDKIEKICTNNKKMKLRVCWQINNKGKNCSKCEKCIRTIMEIVAEGKNPIDYGFEPDYVYIKTFVTKKHPLKQIWKETVAKFQKNKEQFINRPEVNWMLNLDVDKINKRYKRIDQKIIRKIKNIVKGNRSE